MQKFNEVNQIKKEKGKTKIFVITIIALIGIVLIFIIKHLIVALCGIFLVDSAQNAEIEVNRDITEYNYYMAGDNAKENYKVKLGMDESIFPQKITEDMSVKDYMMVYYNPWDAQYLGYLIVEYNENAYKKEMERLKSYNSTEYLGIYGATGFSDKYTLMAMNADESAGFVYALSDDKNTIIYVEMIYGNYFMDLEYEEYIPKEYLPIGFDATVDNLYRKKMIGELY